jgi:stage III sporulation protein AE
VPVLGLTAVLAVSGSVFPNSSGEAFLGLIKKVVTWGMTVVMTLFTGFVTLKCSLAAKADGVATKTAKFMISGFVPVVGSAVSDAYSTVRGSFDVIGGTVGTAGIFAVLLIMLEPAAEIVLFRLVMWIGTAAAEMFSAEPVAKLLKGLDSGLAIAQSVMICYAVMFVISTAILIQ